MDQCEKCRRVKNYCGDPFHRLFGRYMDQCEKCRRRRVIVATNFIYLFQVPSEKFDGENCCREKKIRAGGV